jgi:putative DNA primase/helicase
MSAEVKEFLRGEDHASGCMVHPPGEPLRNARRFVRDEYRHATRPLLVRQGGEWYAYNGTCWPTLDEGELRARLYRYFENKTYIAETKSGPVTKPFAPDRYKVGDLIDATRAVVHVPVKRATPSWLVEEESDLRFLSPADEIVACTNGLIHVPTRTLYPHTPTFYVHHSIGFAFDPTAPTPARWLAFLDELWPGDAESIETLQELFGYIVAGDTRLQKMFLLVGPKRSGKGTIARILKTLVGAHNVAGPTLASLSTNFGLSPLIDKPVAIVADARLKASDTSVVTERLLSISGEDTLTVDRKYREPWTGQIPSRVLILSNELPRLSDSSGALASRFIVLTMSTSFYGRENPNLTAELSTELPGIFNWGVDGLQRLRARGRFLQPAASQDAIRELEDLGSPVGAFVRDECTIGAPMTVPIDVLYDAWKGWSEEHGRHATNAQVFGRDLRAAFPGVRIVRPRAEDGGRQRHYQGIGLVRSGPRTNAKYSQQRGADDGAHTKHCDDREPSRTNGDFAFKRHDDDGEWKSEDGTELL